MSYTTRPCTSVPEAIDDVNLYVIIAKVFMQKKL